MDLLLFGKSKKKKMILSLQYPRVAQLLNSHINQQKFKELSVTKDGVCVAPYHVTSVSGSSHLDLKEKSKTLVNNKNFDDCSLRLEGKNLRDYN